MMVFTWDVREVGERRGGDPEKEGREGKRGKEAGGKSSKSSKRAKEAKEGKSSKRDKKEKEKGKQSPAVPLTRKKKQLENMKINNCKLCIICYCAKRSLLSGPSTGNSEICPFRVPLRIIITFHRGGNAAVDSVLVKYVIFEKISSDPRKYRCKVRLAIHNGHHRDPVLDVYFGDFLETYDKK